MLQSPMDYSLGQRVALTTLPVVAAYCLRMLASSWRVCEEGESDLSGKRKQPESRIYVTWHESIMAMICGYRDQPVHPFASRSYDGELISRLATCLGYPAVARGSSSRGGAQGLREMKTLLEAGQHVYITVDGPRGPRREAKEGSLKLAQLSGRAIVPIAFATRSGWRLKSWDKTIVPGPFSKGIFCFGSALRVPRDAADMQPYADDLKTRLDRCHADADARVQ